MRAPSGGRVRGRRCRRPPGRGGMSPSRLPLRTVHESPPSHGSSKSCTTQLGSPERCDRSGCGRPGRPGTKPGLGRAGSPRGSVCSTGVLHLTCPAVGVLPAVLWVTHLTHVSGLSAQARGPYPPGYDFPVPYGGWPSLLGSSCARCGVGPSFRRSSGLLAGGPDRNGVTMFRTREARRGRVPSVPRGRGVRGGSGSGLPPVCPVIAVVANHHFRRPSMTQPQQRFTHVHPVRLSLARFPRMVRSRLRLHLPAFARFVTWRLRRSGTGLDTRQGHGDSAMTTHRVRLHVATPPNSPLNKSHNSSSSSNFPSRNCSRA